MSDTDSFNNASNTSKGPSPIIPLLLVVALGLLLRGNSSAINLNLPLVSDSENAIFTCVVFIPVVLLLVFYSTSHSIILPLVLVLVSNTVKTMFLGPLVMILIICLATTAYLPSLNWNGEELGWACLLVFFFFLLHWVVSDKSRQSGTLVLAIMVGVYIHLPINLGILKFVKITSTPAEI